MEPNKKLRIQKGLKLTAESDSLNFRTGDIIAGPLAFIYVGGRAFSSIGAYIGQALLWLGGRVVEGVAPKFHKWSLNKIEESYNGVKNWITNHLDNPKTAFGVSFPMILGTIGLSLSTTTLAILSFTTGAVSHGLVEGFAIATKLSQLSLPLVRSIWDKAEGSKGHATIHPIFQTIGTQLQRLDDYVEEIIPVYKRTKELLHKAPLTAYEEKILESMPHFLRHIPKMERAGILAHHMMQTTLELLGKKPVDERYASMTSSGARKLPINVFGIPLDQYDPKPVPVPVPASYSYMDVRDTFTMPQPLDEGQTSKPAFDTARNDEKASDKDTAPANDFSVEKPHASTPPKKDI